MLMRMHQLVCCCVQVAYILMIPDNLFGYLHLLSLSKSTVSSFRVMPSLWCLLLTCLIIF